MMSFKILCSFVFLVLILTAQGYADEHFPFLGEASKPAVHVRAGANTNFESVDKLTKGAEVVVLGRSYEWYQVQLPAGASAFIRADYLKIHDGSIGELIGDRVNVRARAASESSPLGQLKKGDLVKVLTKTNDWWRIEPPAGAVGWVHKDFLNVKSTEIPVQELRKPLVADIRPVKASEPSGPVPVPVSVQGKLMPVGQSSTDVHYQILVAGKPVYGIQDMPHLERFSGVVVRMDGTISSGDQSIPVLHIKKITLVL